MKSVVIASGKGGTGKTTLTALLAHLAGRDARVVVADADVEASNLPLGLHVLDSTCESFLGGQEASVDEAACTGCGLCRDVCRFDALLVGDRDASPAPSSAPIPTVDPWLCEGCGYCAYVCPTGAIQLKARQAGTACSGTSVVGAIAFGQLGPGEDLSGRLVTEVRRRATEAAEKSAANLLFIDGPPGVGCPVIAALAGTDLVVAVAEPTRSGRHDLGRLIALAARFDLPVCVILNKADLSDTGARELAEECAGRGIGLCAEIPFDPAVAASLPKLAAGASLEEVFAGTTTLAMLRQIWKEIERALHAGPSLASVSSASGREGGLWRSRSH
ncbi:MAG: ATP-binding protein [Thermoleophilia bacterium]